MTETYTYICLYCKKEYVPARRRVQKYCSKSCYNGYQNYKRRQEIKPIPKQMELPSVHSKKTKIEKISVAGIGNATAGSLIADTLKVLLTKNEDKPATKGDLLKVLETFDRYHPISKMSARTDGALPYFDLYTNEIVYFGNSNEQNWNTDSLTA